MNSDVYEVICRKDRSEKKEFCVSVPGSKSITNRALLLAAMAEGTSTLSGCLSSEDAVYFLECLKTLGFPVEEVSDGVLGKNISITGFGGRIPRREAEIYVGSAGTAARFLVAMLAFSDGTYLVNSSEQMKKRPMQPLIETLQKAGARILCLEEEGHFPLQIYGVKEKGQIPDSISVDIEMSSQFLSALLIAAGTFGKPMEIRVLGSHGLSYVDLTVEMMKRFGVNAEKIDKGGQLVYRFSGEEAYGSRNYPVEPDLSAAAYFYAMAALLGGKTVVKGVSGEMLQGDLAFLDVLERMGCVRGETESGELSIEGPPCGALKGGFTVDMSAFSDQALTLCAIAPYADAPVTITGIGHIRLQECDRILAIRENLRRLGIVTEELENGITVYPGTPKGCVIETYEDHRVAMSFALTGLRCEGVKILNPSCCKKTFAQYFRVLECCF